MLMRVSVATIFDFGRSIAFHLPRSVESFRLSEAKSCGSTGGTFATRLRAEAGNSCGDCPLLGELRS